MASASSNVSIYFPAKADPHFISPEGTEDRVELVSSLHIDCAVLKGLKRHFYFFTVYDIIPNHPPLIKMRPE